MKSSPSTSLRPLILGRLLILGLLALPLTSIRAQDQVVDLPSGTAVPYTEVPYTPLAPETDTRSEGQPAQDLDDETGESEAAQSAGGEAAEAENVEPQLATQDESQAAQGEPGLPLWRPLLAMGLGVFVVLALMIRLKTHAFVALILGALTISCFVPLNVVGFVKDPGEVILASSPEGVAPSNIVSRVTNSLGGAVAGIGILIAMAAIIGKCMLASGAADQIVKSSMRVFGEKRASLAMMISGFILSIPVFFDTVFYLLVPLARSLYRKTKKNYLLYLCAIAAGGAITHTLVPPTPGPLLVASNLKADLGTVMLIGLMVGLPSAVVGLIASSWLNARMPIEMRPMSGTTEEEELEKLPSLPLALAPVLLPVVLITIATLANVYTKSQLPDPGATPKIELTQAQETLSGVNSWVQLFGSANLAMILAALFSIYLCWKVQGHSLKKIADNVEEALLSGGLIILITAAGGAFGALLAMTQVQDLVKEYFNLSQGASGFLILLIAYVVAALIKVAQGSSTVSMIITVSLVGTVAQQMQAADSLPFNIAYLVPIIGAGSLMGSWMNDSGFWVFAKMGVLTEGETLRSWTILLSILSLTGFVITTIMALYIWPMTS